MELCGGTHVKRTGDIGLFKITMETGIAAGIRRIEAVTGEGAIAWINNLEEQLQETARLFKSGREDLINKAKKNIEYTQQLEKQITQLQGRLAGAAITDLVQQAKEVAGIKLLAAEIDGLDAKSMRDMVDRLKDKLGSAVIVLGSAMDGRAQLVVGVTKDYTDKIKAGDLINQLAGYIGGKGGGRPDFAQAGGDNVQGIKIILQTAQQVIKEMINS